MANDDSEDNDLADIDLESYIFSNKTDWKPRKRLEKDMISHKSPSRVIHFKNQVKSPEELEIGKRYLEMNIEDGPLKQHEILKIDTKSGRCTTMEYFKDGFACESSFSMVDFGVIPDKNGLWNTLNYLLPVKE